MSSAFENGNSAFNSETPCVPLGMEIGSNLNGIHTTNDNDMASSGSSLTNRRVGDSSDSVQKEKAKNFKDGLSSKLCFSWKEKVGKWSDKHVDEHVRFTLRVTLAQTIASLFVLCQSPDPINQGLPSAFWVYVTAGVTSWQSSPDLGSVFKKVWQRFFGTIFGGSVGLALGFLSLLVPISSVHDTMTISWRAFYLGIVQVGMTFVLVYWSCKWGFRGHYSAILGMITAGMVLLAFYDPNTNEAWKTGVFRITNIALGCVVGTCASLVVFPVSTKYLIESKITMPIQNTGTITKKVLLNTKRMEERTRFDRMPSYHELIIAGEKDPSHDAFIRSIEEIHRIKQMLPLLNYDPTFKRMPQKKKDHHIHTWKVKLDRILRIHMNILWLDNILRSKLTGEDGLYSEMLVTIGEHVEELLDTSRSQNDRKITETQLLNEDLPSLRRAIAKADYQRFKRPSFTMVDDPTVSSFEMISVLNRFDEEGTAEFVNLFIEKQTDTFYRMVEILILRIMRLNYIRILEREDQDG